MRVLVDKVTVEAKPDLAEHAHLPSSEWLVEVLEARGPEAIIEAIGRIRPDLIVVNPLWLTFPVLLFVFLQRAQCTQAKRVIASADVDNTVLIRAAYHGFHDVTDLRMTTRNIFGQWGQIQQGIMSLDSNRIWQEIDRPTPVPDVDDVPKDGIDRSILDLICIGLHDRDIARALFISPQTVRNRVSGMLGRSDTDNRTQLAWRYRNQMLAQEFRGLL